MLVGDWQLIGWLVWCNWMPNSHLMVLTSILSVDYLKYKEFNPVYSGYGYLSPQGGWEGKVLYLVFYMGRIALMYLQYYYWLLILYKYHKIQFNPIVSGGSTIHLLVNWRQSLAEMSKGRLLRERTQHSQFKC
jgi:hypothetical protein